MKHTLPTTLLLAALFTSSSTIAHANSETSHYRVDLAPVNGSGVYATVVAKVTDGKTLHVSINAAGLEPDKLHPQHIHGINNPVKKSTCPTQANDVDGDGIISIQEGVPSFGPILIPLVPFNLVDSAGHLSYEATLTINPGDLQPLHKRTIVMHGATVNGAYIPSLPVACGELIRID